MFTSKLKEALICFKNLRVTLPYPFEPSIVPEGFRGIPEMDVDKCLGCGGCANVCPPRCIVIEDNNDKRTLKFNLDRCTYCGRCAEVCPEKAITMSKEFETATNNRKDLLRTYEIYMGSCGRCGRCFKPANPLDKMMVTGFR